MTEIYLIRHAEAEGNLYRRAQGQYNSCLTQLGRRQTAALAERFRTVPVDALWASDLIRTQSTASAILKYHPQLTMHTDRALREVDVGCWEDRAWGELDAEQPEQRRLFTQDPDRWSVPGSERFGDVQRRIEGALLGLGSAYPGKTVVAVSHAFAIRALASLLTGTPYGKLPYGDNTAVTHIRAQDGKLTLLTYGDASHLGALSTFAHQGLSGDHMGRKADACPAPLILPEEKDYYTRCYSQTWLASHGDLTGFSPALYLHAAAQHAREDSRCLTKLLYGGQTVGLIELDPERGAEDGAGWISLIWVEPDQRGRRFGAQLVGHAVSFFRRKGRRAIRLHASQTNAAALGFYDSLGFTRLGEAEGVGGPLYLMEMDIVPRVWLLP